MVRRSFNKAFKIAAVKLALDDDMSVSEVYERTLLSLKLFISMDK